MHIFLLLMLQTECWEVAFGWKFFYGR